MQRALWTAAAGMAAQQTNLDVISNNLANVNTTGFKRSRAEFQDLLYQTINAPGTASSASTNLPVGVEIGLGTKTAATKRIFSQGDFKPTENPLDLVVEGDGFFKVTRPDGTLAYTRDGSFTTNESGNIVNSLGYLLGRWGGRALLQRLRLSETLLQSLERGFSRYGGGLLVVARFFDGPRQLNGITAGILEMPGWRFSLYNALGALLWASVWSLGVYTVDTHLHAFLAILRQCNPWVAGLTLMAMALAAAALWRARR